jgi:hypothetical protein
MRIWQVVFYDTAHAFYFKPTKREADALAKQLREDDPEASIDVEPYDFPATRVGIANAFQGFVDYTCMNEH